MSCLMCFPVINDLYITFQWAVGFIAIQTVEKRSRPCVKWSQHHDLMPYALCTGSSYYDNVRPLAYPDSDAVLICFDISRPETLDSVIKKVSFFFCFPFNFLSQNRSNISGVTVQLQKTPFRCIQQLPLSIHSVPAACFLKFFWPV